MQQELLLLIQTSKYSLNKICDSDKLGKEQWSQKVWEWMLRRQVMVSGEEARKVMKEDSNSVYGNRYNKGVSSYRI